MAYLPKNKYKIKYTNGGEFIIKSTGELYIGNYLELPNNIFYAGTDPQLITEELKIFIPPSTNIPNTKSNAIFGVLNKTYVDKEKNYTTPIASKTFPTDEDYTNGSMLRYFGQQIQTGRYFEVDKQTYSDIRTSDRIDRSIYTQGQIRWALKGDTEQINGANLLRLEKSYPNLRSLFSNLTEFRTAPLQFDCKPDVTLSEGDCHPSPLPSPTPPKTPTPTPPKTTNSSTSTSRGGSY